MHVKSKIRKNARYSDLFLFYSSLFVCTFTVFSVFTDFITLFVHIGITRAVDVSHHLGLVAVLRVITQQAPIRVDC